MKLIYKYRLFFFFKYVAMNDEQDQSVYEVLIGVRVEWRNEGKKALTKGSYRTQLFVAFFKSIGRDLDVSRLLKLIKKHLFKFNLY